jgi:hypothetical protein
MGLSLPPSTPAATTLHSEADLSTM